MQGPVKIAWDCRWGEGGKDSRRRRSTAVEPLGSHPSGAEKWGLFLPLGFVMEPLVARVLSA